MGHENRQPLSDSDQKQSMDLHKKILNQEIYFIDKELLGLVKSKETLDYLITLIHKRDLITNQIDRIDKNIKNLDF